MLGRWNTRERAPCWVTSTLDLATQAEGGRHGEANGRMTTAENVPDQAKLSGLRPEGKRRWHCQWEETLGPGAAHSTLHNPNRVAAWRKQNPARLALTFGLDEPFLKNDLHSCASEPYFLLLLFRRMGDFGQGDLDVGVRVATWCDLMAQCGVLCPYLC